MKNNMEKETKDAIEQTKEVLAMERPCKACVFSNEACDWCIENNFGINFNCWCLYKCFDAIRYAKEKDVTIGAWTVDNTVIADVMVLIGAKYITTNKILP